MVGAVVVTLAMVRIPVYEVAPALFLTPLFHSWARLVWSHVCPVVCEATRTSVTHHAPSVDFVAAVALPDRPTTSSPAASPAMNVPLNARMTRSFPRARSILACRDWASPQSMQ